MAHRSSCSVNMVPAYSFPDSQITVLSSSATLQDGILLSKQRNNRMMFLGFLYFRTGIFLGGTNPIMAIGGTIWIGVVRRVSARVYRPHSSRRQDEEMIKSHGTVCECVSV